MLCGFCQRLTVVQTVNGYGVCYDPVCAGTARMIKPRGTVPVAIIGQPLPLPALEGLPADADEIEDQQQRWGEERDSAATEGAD